MRGACSHYVFVVLWRPTLVRVFVLGIGVAHGRLFPVPPSKSDQDKCFRGTIGCELEKGV